MSVGSCSWSTCNASQQPVVRVGDVRLLAFALFARLCARVRRGEGGALSLLVPSTCDICSYGQRKHTARH
eukprot:7072174-Prymnesium_polylepis.1